MTRKSSRRRQPGADPVSEAPWAGFTSEELEAKRAALLKLLDSGTLTARSLDQQLAEITMIDIELDRRDGR
ncbi:MAG: hypothetical protein AAGL24_19450 [Pseudomonadota bacterium]